MKIEKKDGALFEDDKELPGELRDKTDVRVAFRIYKPRFRCEHCGESHPSCIMFYDPEVESVVGSASVNRVRAARPEKTMKAVELLELLEGAEAVCQNCYRKRYHRDLRYFSREQKALLKEIEDCKRDAGCATCEENDPLCLDLHHRNGEEKSFNVHGGVMTLDRNEIITEMRKCDVQCANCHCKIHWDQRTLAAEKTDCEDRDEP